MFAAVSFAGPFFHVYMLRELHFTYLEFMGNMLAAAVTQAALMPFWGRVRDMSGNRVVIVISGALIPLFTGMRRFVAKGSFPPDGFEGRQ